MISFIYIDTEELVLELDKASESKDSALEWVERMRDTLIFGGRRKDPLPFGLHCITVSKGYVANGKIGRWKRNAISELKKRDIDSPDNDEIIAEMYASHGSDYEEALEDIKAANEAKKRGFTADGDIREDSQNVTDGSNAGTLESRTSAEPLGGRGHSPESDSSALKPLPPSKSKKPKVEKHPHGEFQNVMLTDDEYIKACASIQDCDSMIERMSSYKASSGKKYKSDYAALLNWARRDEERPAQSQAPMYKTAADRDREEIQKIADYYAAQERGEKPPMPKIQLVEGL